MCDNPEPLVAGEVWTDGASFGSVIVVGGRHYLLGQLFARVSSVENANARPRADARERAEVDAMKLEIRIRATLRDDGYIPLDLDPRPWRVDAS